MPDTDSTVRLATLADLSAMHGILATCLDAEPGMLGFFSSRQALRWLAKEDFIGRWRSRLELTPDQTAMLVATAPDGTVAGFAEGALCTARLKSVPKPHNCMLDRMAVHPNHRGHGYGHALLKGFAARARQIGCGGMMLIVYESQQAALSLYQQHGYSIHRSSPDEDGLPLHHMSRPLDLPRQQPSSTRYAAA